MVERKDHTMSNENTIILEAQDIPVAYETEVLVVGGGSGGFSAAIAAARNGAETMLIEQRNHLGGLATGGLVSVFMNRNYDVHGGIYNELIRELYARDGIIENTHQSQGFDREIYKMLLQEKVMEAGVKLLFHVRCIDVIKENNTIKGVVINSLAGKQAILSKIVIDCTRIASVAQRADADLLVPDQPKSFLTWNVLRNVNFPRLLALLREDKDYITEPTKHAVSPPPHGGVNFWQVGLWGGQTRLKEAKERGDFTFDKNETFLFGMIDSGPNRMKFLTWLSIYNKLQPLNQETGEFDIDAITESEFNMREQQWAVYEYLKKCVKGFEYAEMDLTSNENGYFAKRIEGDWIMSDEEALDGAIHEDSVAIASWFIDKADCRRFDCNLNDIPFRGLYSKNVENLMAGGYNISTNEYSSIKIVDQPTCIDLGQASGVAAAQAVKQGVNAKKVDIQKLQATLLSQGAKVSVRYLPDAVVKEYDDAVKAMREAMKTQKNERFY
jgi:hypothetical protein